MSGALVGNGLSGIQCCFEFAFDSDVTGTNLHQNVLHLLAGCKNTMQGW